MSVKIHPKAVSFGQLMTECERKESTKLVFSKKEVVFMVNFCLGF